MEHHGSADVQGLCDIVDGVAAVISADEHILLTFRESADEVLNRLFQYDFIVLFFNVAFSGNAFRKLVKACGVFGWRFLTILEIYALKFFGLSGGMFSQSFKYVSLTHSALSSSFARMLKAIVWRYFPYCEVTIAIAVSSRRRNALMMLLSFAFILIDVHHDVLSL